MKATYLHGPIIQEMSQAQLLDGEHAGHNGMKLDKSGQYEYIKIDDYYFCLRQNPIALAWLLFSKREDLITIQPWLKKDYPRWKLQYFRYHWRMVKRNFFNLMFFTLCRLDLRNLETVHLPVYGQFGMSVHKGFKIFNFRTRTVTKIFDSNVDKSSVASEIEQLKKVSDIEFAPALRSWDIDEGWYQEDYIRSKVAAAHRSADSGKLLEAFYQEAVPCMNSLISHRSPKTKDLQVYLGELRGILDGSKLLKNGPNLTESKILRSFVNATEERLNDEGHHPVNLVFTHGDFCPANFLGTNDGIKIVDWETATYRSLLFDFYSYFFYRVTSGRLPVDQVASEINEALPNFVSGLSLKAPDITKNVLASVNIYRRLFYLEYLSKLVERDLTDNRLNMTDYILLYIRAFREHEQKYNKEIRNGHVHSIISNSVVRNNL